jgi:hypothetical protein
VNGERLLPYLGAILALAVPRALTRPLIEIVVELDGHVRLA